MEAFSLHRKQPVSPNPCLGGREDRESIAHSEHRFPAPSSKLCKNWLRHWRGTLYLRAAVHRRGQRPPKVLGTDMTAEAAYRPSTHANMRRIHPGLKKKRKKKEEKKEFRIDSDDCGFIFAGVN